VDPKRVYLFGHSNGASHDTSRILRRSYHTPAYVTLAAEAYADWEELERECGQQLVTTTGGLDFFPPGAAIAASDYTDSLAACGVSFEVLDAAAVTVRWPALRLPRLASPPSLRPLAWPWPFWPWVFSSLLNLA
jgi:sarcosine oxidase